MSLGSQDIAEAREAREYWERIVQETEDDVRYELSRAGFTRPENSNALDVAALRGMALMENLTHKATVWYDGQGYHADIRPRS